MKKFIVIILIISSIKAHAQDGTFLVHFDLGRSALNEAAIRVLDSLTYHQKLVPGKNISIAGYTDDIGTDQSNIQLSVARAQAVKEYLLKSGFAIRNMEVVEGRGEVKENIAGQGDNPAYNRKVEIMIGGNYKAMTKDTSKNNTVFKPQVFDLSKAAVNTAIRLNNMLFHGGSYEPLKISTPVLENLGKFMTENPQVKIRIEGHVCCATKNQLRDDLDNDHMWLSIRRAKTVYDYLVSIGINKDRLSYTGFAGSKPLISPEKDEYDRMLNRRVEIRILEK